MVSMVINIYYQAEFYGKEIANSLSRYLRYCLDEGNVVKIELDISSTKIIDNLDHKHLIIFTSLEHDSTYWITLVDKILTYVNKEECYLKIIDLTWRTDFPIIAGSGAIISISNKECLNWLPKLNDWSYKPVEIKLTDNIKKQFCNEIKHRMEKSKGEYKSKLEKYINNFGWNDNLKASLIETCMRYEES